MNVNVRRVYLYLTSLVGLVLIIIGTTQLINLALKTYVFTKADDNYYGPCYERAVAPVKEGEAQKELSKEECDDEQREQRTARRQSEASHAVAFILVGAPVWLYHWSKVKEEREP